MTLRDYIDEITMRLSRLAIDRVIADTEIIGYINRARQYVFKQTYALMPERYTKLKSISTGGTLATNKNGVNSYKFELPSDFVVDYVVWVQYLNDGRTYRPQARKAENQEFYSVGSHNWVKPSKYNPVYYIDSDQTFSNVYGKKAYINISLGDSLFDTPTVNGSKIDVLYVAALNDLQLWSNTGATVQEQEITIPEEYDELIIINALMMCLREINVLQSNENVKLEYEFLTKMTKTLSEQMLLKYQVDIPSKGV